MAEIKGRKFTYRIDSTVWELYLNKVVTKKIIPICVYTSNSNNEEEAMAKYLIY